MSFYFNYVMQTTMFQPTGGMDMIGKAFAQRVDTAFQRFRIGRADDEVRPVPPFAEEGIAANLASFVGLFHVTQQHGHFAFRHPAACP